MYALVVLLLIIGIIAVLPGSPAEDAEKMMAARARATAEQMVAHQLAAVSSITPAEIVMLPPGVVSQSQITFPDWYTAAPKFTTTTDSNNLLVTYYAADPTLWGAMASVLAKRGNETVNGGRIRGGALTGTIVKSPTGAYLQTQTKLAAKITLPAAVVASAPSGAPAIVSVIE